MENEQMPVMPPNTGVQDREIVPGDFVAEGDTGITYQVVLADGDWQPFAFPDDGDYQHGVYFDGLTCTNYGWGHSSEMQLNRMLELGLFTADEIARLTEAKFIVDGKFTRLSKRYNAIKSGTNGGQIPNMFLGNYAYKPWDAARHWGAVPESVCPFPRLQRTPPFTMEQYFDKAAAETPECEAAAAVWLSIFETRYEVVPTDDEFLIKHIKQAPLCINVGVCPGWSSGNVAACSEWGGHIVTKMKMEPDESMRIEDSYKPSRKRLADAYGIASAHKGVVLIKRLIDAPTPPQAPEPAFKFTAMQLGDRSEQVKKLQDLLKIKGFFPKYVESTGYYWTVTAGAVLKYQLANKVGNPALLKSWRGHFVGPLTLPFLNR